MTYKAIENDGMVTILDAYGQPVVCMSVAAWEYFSSMGPAPGAHEKGRDEQGGQRVENQTGQVRYRQTDQDDDEGRDVRGDHR